MKGETSSAPASRHDRKATTGATRSGAIRSRRARASAPAFAPAARAARPRSSGSAPRGSCLQAYARFRSRGLPRRRGDHHVRPLSCQVLAGAHDSRSTMLHVPRSDRADGLVEALRSLLAAPPDDPFAPEVVAVPTRGMERWLPQRMSAVLGASSGRADGICANVDFPFPRRLTGDAVAAASGIEPSSDPWLPERLLWPPLRGGAGVAGGPG